MLSVADEDASGRVRHRWCLISSLCAKECSALDAWMPRSLADIHASLRLARTAGREPYPSRNDLSNGKTRQEYSVTYIERETHQTREPWPKPDSMEGEGKAVCIWRRACAGIGFRSRFGHAVHAIHAYIHIHPRAYSGEFAKVTKQKPYSEYATAFLLLAEGADGRLRGVPPTWTRRHK